jgi:hypothetical protein
VGEWLVQALEGGAVEPRFRLAAKQAEQRRAVY